MAFLKDLFKGLLKLYTRFIFKALTLLFPQRLEINNIVLHLNNFQNDKPLTVVQLSDIHYDHTPLRMSDSFMDEIIEKTNKLKPDIIVITGDLVQFSPYPIKELYEKHLIRLKAKNGVYAILGNHDYKTKEGPTVIRDQLLNTNIQLLQNEIVYPLGKGNGMIQLIGLGDYGKKKADFNIEKVRNEIESKKKNQYCKLVLSHNPDSIIDLKDSGLDLDLVLSGHSHGGQICLPNGTPLLKFLDPWIAKLPTSILCRLPYPGKVVKHWEYAKGLHTVNSSNSNYPIKLYINKGLGTHPFGSIGPVRLFCHPEITVFTIEPPKI
ncbi:hypothetical protein CYY_004706 [Polysphondylium violaceum]|uniref:Calcineurin-like phosphoesterase domain-containing protein n=1 Tax=Polysphondylium violaceum TaxID=133409 RepID=A0A8J4PWG4_9MYCE|nr:hypothetical protein CYY_004706 [Polysphondylium violaceum]